MSKLTDKQKKFVNEYLIDLNATRAYKAVYSSCKKDETARANGSRLLTNANVVGYLDERQKKLEERTEITQDRVLKEIASVAFANGTDFATLDVDGGSIKVKFVPTALLSADKKAAIAGIKETQVGIEIKLNDKMKALELLGKHLGMFTDKVELRGSIEADVKKLDDVISQLRGVNNEC